MLDALVAEVAGSPRLLLSALTMAAMAGCTANAILIWAFNPGGEMKVEWRTFFHAAAAFFLMRRFVLIARSEGMRWDFEAATGVIATGILAVAAAGLFLHILEQVERDRERRQRLRAEAERRRRQ